MARTGWDQDGPLLGFVTYGRLLENRSAVVADLDTDEILVLDSDLRPSATFGGNGQGPGEFGGIGGVAEVAPDSIVVWDGSQARATIFDVENLGFRTAGYNPAGGVEHTVAATSGRDLLWVPRAPYARPVETSQWLRIPVLRSDAAIERIDTVVSLPFAEVVISGGSGGRPTTRPIPRTAEPDRFFFMDSRDGVVLGREVNELGVHAIALYQRPECPTV